MREFFIPFSYFCYTRLKGKLRKASFFVIYFFPLTLLAMWGSRPVLFENVILLLFGFWCTYCAYELGYIYNDFEKTKKERFPTKRNTLDLSTYYERNKILIYFFRFLLVLMNTLIGFLLGLPIISLVTPWLLIVFFFIYNKLDNNVNLLLHFILVSLRYFCPLSVFGFHLASLLLPMIFFALPNTIERTREEKFNFYANPLCDFFNNTREGRYRYYAVVSIAHLLILVFSQKEIIVVSLLFNIYFLFYRYLSTKILCREF